jgi:triosephosphate isomerase (TIM)
MRRWVIANWKMHKLKADSKAFFEELSSRLKETQWQSVVHVGVAPPATLLSYCAELTKSTSIKVGAQNCHFKEQGAFTGELAPQMIKDSGAEFVIIGHSERRSLFGESDAFVADKLKAVHQAGLFGVLCVGETLEERERGQTNQIVERQLDAALSKFDGPKTLVVAYEPVWAIGTGRTATPEQAQEVHAFIRQKLNSRFGAFGQQIPILYGGSVKPSNFAELLSQNDVDGGLVGGASLDANDFYQLVGAACKV